MRNPKAGLRVGYYSCVVRRKKGYAAEIVKATREGWYIEVLRSGKWLALMDLRFAREKDALRAVQSLNSAGLDTIIAINRADPITVKQVACEHLQW